MKPGLPHTARLITKAIITAALLNWVYGHAANLTAVFRYIPSEDLKCCCC